jgi:hypothetical protein
VRKRDAVKTGSESAVTWKSAIQKVGNRPRSKPRKVTHLNSAQTVLTQGSSSAQTVLKQCSSSAQAVLEVRALHALELLV